MRRIYIKGNGKPVVITFWIAKHCQPLGIPRDVATAFLVISWTPCLTFLTETRLPFERCFRSWQDILLLLSSFYNPWRYLTFSLRRITIWFSTCGCYCIHDLPHLNRYLFLHLLYASNLGEGFQKMQRLTNGQYVGFNKICLSQYCDRGTFQLAPTTYINIYLQCALLSLWRWKVENSKI